MALDGIVVIVGNYGSGKSEVSLNLAIARKKGGADVRIADLDLVNPYFRSREARDLLTNMGVDIVLPPKEYMHADLPILTPAVSGMIRKPSEVTLLDAGGDDVGATVLSALADAIQGKEMQIVQVINPFRPFTDTPEGCEKIRQEIESASRLKVNGLIGNAHLMEHTQADDIYRGYEFAAKVAEKGGLPLEYITADKKLIPKLDLERFECPVLPIERLLLPPWKK